MALQITTETPLLTMQQLPLRSFYAVATNLQYDKSARILAYNAAYFVSREARAAGAACLVLPGLPTGLALHGISAQALNESRVYERIYADLEQQIQASLQQPLQIEVV